MQGDSLIEHGECCMAPTLQFIPSRPVAKRRSRPQGVLMRISMVFAAILLALCIASPAHAQAADPSTSQLTGTVVSTGNISMVVRGDDGQERNFVLVSTTLMPLQRVAAGDRVAVRYRTLDA